MASYLSAADVAVQFICRQRQYKKPQNNKLAGRRRRKSARSVQPEDVVVLSALDGAPVASKQAALEPVTVVPVIVVDVELRPDVPHRRRCMNLMLVRASP